MPAQPRASRAGVYAEAARFADRSLRSGLSLLGAGRLWSATSLGELARRLDDPPSGDGFAGRWARTLHGADPSLVRLATELLAVHLLFPLDIGGARKLELLAATLAFVDLPPELPSHTERALRAGVAPTGVAFKATRLSQLSYLARAAAALRTRRPADRERALGDHAAFRAALHDVPPCGGGPQRDALLHLVFPRAFEPIVSASVKRRIVSALADHPRDGAAGASVDLDTSLASIRRRLAGQHGRGFRFTDPEIAAAWR